MRVPIMVQQHPIICIIMPFDIMITSIYTTMHYIKIVSYDGTLSHNHLNIHVWENTHAQV